MGHLEAQQGLPPGEYSPPFLEVDAESGPWLIRTQQASRIVRGGYPDYELDAEAGVMRFGDAGRFGLLAAVQILGTYSPEDHQWLWAWANPKLEQASAGLAAMRDEHEHVPELTNPTFKCTETKAWALAAAAAHLLGAQECYRIPGEIQTFVALTQITELGPEDPRGERPRQDPQRAEDALAQYAGPAAVNLGTLLVSSLQTQEPPLDAVLSALNTFSENLELMARSPVGQDTPAAQDAQRIAELMRKAVLCLSVPDPQALLEGARDVLSSLEFIARQFGAWPADEAAPPATAEEDAP